MSLAGRLVKGNYVLVIKGSHKDKIYKIRSVSYESDHVVLKVNSGYNLVFSIKIVKKVSLKNNPELFI